MNYNPSLKTTVFQVVNNQLTENNPSYVNLTFERLISDGMSEQKAKEAIASALLSDIYEVMKNHIPFILERRNYTRRLCLRKFGKNFRNRKGK